MKFKENTDEGSARYWDDLTELYQKETRISTRDFHYGPLLPGDSVLGLLPPVKQRSCLEIGCGAGQNSIFLAKQGAQCMALDISEKQLAHGRKLAEAEGVEVDFQCVSMDSLEELQNPPRPAGTPPQEGISTAPLDGKGSRHSHTEALGEGGSNATDGGGQFDLIHSSYALPFSADPKRVIKKAAAMLNPGGTLLLTTGHPLYAGEWLEIGDGEDGVFLPDYFRPEADVRMALDDGAVSAARYWPISQIAEWIHEAGLVIERLLEPAPMPTPEMSEEKILEKVPYESADWRTLYDQLARIPVVVIFKCKKA